MTKTVEESLLDLYGFGRQQVVVEAKKQGVTADIQAAEPKPDFLAMVHLRAVALANILANKLKESLAWEAMNQMRTGDLSTTTLTSVLTSLSDKELNMAIGASTTEALNLGRLAQAAQMEDQIVEVTSSAILDKGTCEFCEKMDGKHWAPGDEPASEPPYSSCAGRDKCRCIWVYKFAKEA